MKIKIGEENLGSRLDKFLTKELKSKTRSQIQKIIVRGLVLINGEEKSAHYKLKEGDELIVKKEKKEKKKKDNKRNFEIIFENKEFLVINKPAGLIVHGARHIDEITLADLLVKKYPKLKKVGEDRERPGIVHRLDKDVSGLMVIAKTNESFKNLKEQFLSREAVKGYLALVYGQIEKDEDEIDFPIKRAAAGNRQVAVPEGYESNKEKVRKAVTYFEVVKKFINYTLLVIKTKTGRKHQVRVHLAAYGHPVVGDGLYHTKKTKESNKKINLGRIFLLANKLAFKDLAGKKHNFEIDFSDELENFLKTLK